MRAVDVVGSHTCSPGHIEETLDLALRGNGKHAAESHLLAPLYVWETRRGGCHRDGTLSSQKVRGEGHGHV